MALIHARDVGRKLNDGDRFKIAFDRNESAFLWDLMVDYDDGDKPTWNAPDLCSVFIVALRYDATSGKTFALGVS